MCVQIFAVPEIGKIINFVSYWIDIELLMLGWLKYIQLSH